jgi:hypothetical protein
MLLRCAIQVTVVFVEPVTVAVKECCAPVARLMDCGLIVTATAVGDGDAVTVTLTDALFVVSAALVAVTMKFPLVIGAVYSPLLLMLPPEADQVTAP